ncbi:hypothetical protein IWW36_004459, partial [Coemansia brasiliensis]
LDANELLGERKDWLGGLTTYITQMHLNNTCPKVLYNLAIVMFTVLFESKEYSISDIINDEADPRCSYLTDIAWAEIFRELELSSIRQLSHIEKLFAFSRNNQQHSFTEVAKDKDW